MNRKLKKQIEIYSGVAGAILVAGKASGQIVYTDISPDTLLDVTIINNATYNLDMDNDANTDFIFSASKGASTSSGISYTYRGFQATPQGSNLVLGDTFILSGSTGAQTFYVPKKLNAGDSINTANWANNATSSYLYAHVSVPALGLNIDFGKFAVGDDAYIGVKLMQGGQTHFGWIRVALIDTNKYVIKSLAFESQPGAGILAGDTGAGPSGISEKMKELNIFANHENIHINSTEPLENATIQLYDLLGKEILTKTFSGNETSLTIDKKGIYFVEVRSEKGIYRKKVFVY